MGDRIARGLEWLPKHVRMIHLAALPAWHLVEQESKLLCRLRDCIVAEPNPASRVLRSKHIEAQNSSVSQRDGELPAASLAHKEERQIGAFLVEVPQFRPLKKQPAASYA
ncbi:MAG: hypothetical protein ACK52I_36765 [Pseudomonadota bacterium]